MIKIILVEDTKEMQEITKSIIRKVLFSLDKDIEIELHNQYNSNLENTIHDQSIQKIYLLDIELKNSISGIEIAQIIRNEDWDSEIIFLTNHDKMFEKVYRSLYKVFNFIEKFDNLEKRLTKDLKTILGKKHDNKMFIYSSRKISLHLFLKDIMYIARDKSTRKLIIYTTKNHFLLSSSICNMKEKLDDRFAIVHRSCIINKNRVTEYDWIKGSFTLDNGEKIFLLSKKFKDNIL